MLDARREPHLSAGRRPKLGRCAVLFAISVVGFACSLLAPSDEELQGGVSSGLAPGAGAGGSSAGAADFGTGGTVPVAGATGGSAPGDVGVGGSVPVDPGTGGTPPEDGGSGLDASGEPPAEPCGVPVDCTITACAGVGCAGAGRICAAGACVCPGGDAPETDCANGADDDCDGLDDCLDPDCERAQCGTEERRCCGGRCADTTQDEENCQGCDLRCAPGQLCVRIEDASGVRGHCSCDATTECPNNPAQICRQMNGDGQDDLCACDVLQTGNAGCGVGQECLDVPLANFCRYPTP